MMRKLIPIIFLMLTSIVSTSQIPSKFNYQAVLRDNTGELIVNQSVSVRISILSGSATGSAVYTETHSVTTNDYGLVNLQIGAGTTSSDDLSTLDWSVSKYLKIEVDQDGGSTYTALGTSQLLSVPYSLYALKASDVAGGSYYSSGDTLFVVKDTNGNPVFAVFSDGAIVYMNEGSKGKVGGFAVSGRTPGKAIEEDYLRITPDSARIYINQAEGKGKVGGFAVSGRTPGKANASTFMDLTPENYFIGEGAGYSNTGGLYNSFIGYNAGFSNTDGSQNTFLGYYCGFGNTVGSHNVFIGDSTGVATNTGNYNVFLGNYAGRSNTDGWRNVNIGAGSGFFNTSGNRNVFLGTTAGYYNDTGTVNVFIGNSSGANNIGGHRNVFIGSYAGYWNETGNDNVFLGLLSGKSNTTGSNNIFLGNGSGFNNDTASLNIFIGNQSGYYNSEGRNNIFIGTTTGHNNTTGELNTMIGGVAGYNNTTGSGNTFLGIYSGNENSAGNDNVFVGGGAGSKNTTGSYNVFLGAGSGTETTNGSRNVFLGTEAGYHDTTSNRLYIENSTADSTQALIWGNFEHNILSINGYVGIDTLAPPRKFYVNGDAGGIEDWNAVSDVRLKTNISSISNALERVMQLRGVSFEWKNTSIHKSGKNIGLIAQEAKEIIPELVSKAGEYYSIQYAPITALLVEGMKEQQNQIEELKDENQLLKEQNILLLERLKRIEAALNLE